MSRRALFAAVVVAAIALVASGCGSDDSSSSDATPTATWADGLCSAITTWTSSISSIASTLQSSGLSQDSISTAADDAKAATDTFTSDLKGLGKPDTEAGQQARDAVDQLTTDIDADVAKIEDALNGASGVAGVLAAAPVVASTLATARTQVSSTISTLEGLDAKGELESAFKDSSSCDTLTGS